MRVRLVGEGTYPVTKGGVGTWSDQLIRGLPEVDFSVTVLTAGRAVAAYELPPNVSSVFAADMWGPIPARKADQAQALAGLRGGLGGHLRPRLRPGRANATRDPRRLAGADPTGRWPNGSGGS